jgi:hypothetical protein
MRVAPRIAWLAAAIGGALLLAAPSGAQRVRETEIRENPYHDVGGSCVYGRSGELLFAPQGANCPAREQPPASVAPAGERAALLPESQREEARALLAEREALRAELARVREAIAYEDRESAARVVEGALREIARHLEREARLLEAIDAGRAKP